MATKTLTKQLSKTANLNGLNLSLTLIDPTGKEGTTLPDVHDFAYVVPTSAKISLTGYAGKGYTSIVWHRYRFAEFDRSSYDLIKTPPFDYNVINLPVVALDAETDHFYQVVFPAGVRAVEGDVTPKRTFVVGATVSGNNLTPVDLWVTLDAASDVTPPAPPLP